jgi:disulfide bond formation protein DsbB
MTVGSDDRRARAVVGGAWVVACVATLGSLNYSLNMGLVPCRLCWYQRILMYPLVVVLGVATLYPGQDRAVGRFVLPLSVLGAGVAGYHSWLQATVTQCTFAGPCAAIQYEALGLLTIPNQALVAFSLISLAVGYVSVRAGALAEISTRIRALSPA